MRTLTFPEAAEAVKIALDIVDIVSRQVVLKKAGRNFLGLCPFHPEKTPSFNVNREKNLFKCFGCGEAGDALSFLMKRENKTYGEVIRELANEQGIDIIADNQQPEQFTQQQDAKQKILTLNEMSQQFFHQELKASGGSDAMQYLGRRQITPDLVESFGLGFAPAGWEHLTQHLTQKADFVRSNPDILVEAGLSNPRVEGNGFYDRFRNRLIIPIHDERGRVVGFGGRALSDEDKPKYLNSPETQVYVKNRILYGLHQARESIRQSKFAVVMEGYFDVISAHWGGVPQAVGSCGTALSENHLKLLTRFGAETVYLAFDSDDAGLKAAMSAIELIEPYVHTSDLSLKIVIIPTGKDPDEFIRKSGGEAFRHLMDTAQSFLDFKFTYVLRGMDLKSQEGRVSAANRITPLIANIRQPVLRSELMKRYADHLKISEEALILEVKRYEQVHNPYRKDSFKNFQNFSKKEAISDPARRSLKRTSHREQIVRVSENMTELRKPLSPKHIAAEKSLLKLVFFNTESYQMMFSCLESINLAYPSHQKLREAILCVGQPGDALEVLLSKLQEYLYNHLVGQDDVLRLYADTVLTAESFMNQLQLEDLSPALFQERVLQEAAKYRLIIEEHQKKEKLMQLANQSRDLEQHSNVAVDVTEDQSELSLLELQYEIREKLSKRKKELM